MRGRALVHERGKDGGRTSGIEDVPPGPEGEPADLQGSRDFLFFFDYLGIVCVCCEALSDKVVIVKWSVCRVGR